MGKRRSKDITRIKYEDSLLLDTYCLESKNSEIFTELDEINEKILNDIISGEAFICEKCLNRLGIRIYKPRGKNYSSLCKCSNTGCNTIGSYLIDLKVNEIKIDKEDNKNE